MSGEKRRNREMTGLVCSVCEQPWEETYEEGGHGEIPIVRKFGTITPDGLRASVPAVAFFSSVVSEVLTPVMNSHGFVYGGGTDRSFIGLAVKSARSLTYDLKR